MQLTGDPVGVPMYLVYDLDGDKIQRGRAFSAYSMRKFVRAMTRCSRGDVGVSLIEGDDVNAMKILGIILIVGGILGLVYGGFTYTKDTHEAKIGPLVLSVTDKETVNVPIWAGVGAIVIGGLLLVFGRK